ncbi:hypothetical protein POWCR01_000091700 [Plasmodium ovale]|uniref:PIR protein n=1 Tax=Plasmodium ovale TaxID=36330 RepID=A0A1C3KHI0_PLAOA|nr:hypothetical protein POWCR01_000091700 [Plasmodium ovale]
MTINSTNENYETVKVYLYYYNILNDTNDPTSEISDDFFRTHFSNGIDNRSKFIKNCKRLNYYITRSISTECHNNDACFEITNYWLNDEVRTDSDQINRALLDKYKEFMGEYNKTKSYVSKIYYINNELFSKKKVLYELYDEYDKLYNLLEPFDHSKCAHLATIVNSYNNIITQYPQKDNNNFSVTLTDFKSHVQKKAEEYIALCGRKIPDFKSFVENPLYGIDETRNLLQTAEDLGDFHSQESENLGSTITITFFGTTVGIFFTLMLFYKVNKYSIKIHYIP